MKNNSELLAAKDWLENTTWANAYGDKRNGDEMLDIILAHLTAPLPEDRERAIEAVSKAWTDYPFASLGDTEGSEAPIRECKILSYDGNKLLKIVVEGNEEEIKSGYVYKSKGRYGNVESYTHLDCINLETIRAALQQPSVDEWQPIETAPKDGTEVLVFTDVATVHVVHIAWYRSEEDWQSSGQYCWDEGKEDWLGWWSYTENSITQSKLEGYKAPTHWMPLQTPPAQHGGDDE